MSRNRSHMGIRTKSTVSNTVLYVILVLMSIIWLTPFACILLESFRTESTGRVGYIIPKQWGFDNYINLWTKTSFPIWFRNTLITALATAVLQTLMASLQGQKAADEHLPGSGHVPGLRHHDRAV